MTIKEYAKQEGISPQAVYQRLKKNKIKIESLTEKGTGEITGEGMAILNKLFDPENRQTKPIKDELIEALNNQLSTLKEENAKLIERLNQKADEIESIKSERDYLRKALESEQNNYAQIIKLLPAPGQTTSGTSERLTWRERLTGRRKGSSK